MSTIRTEAGGSPPRLDYVVSVGLAASLLLLIALLPLLISGRAVLTNVCQIEIAVIFALSYNMLLGETGLFSFGHAVFLGLGGFVAIHVLRLVAARHLPVPLVLLPVFGSGGGLLAGAIFGWLATRRSGTAFIMITLGFSELISASAFILTDFFGGEEGISGDRTTAASILGWDFGPQIQVYYLTGVWMFLAIAAIYALRFTPLGRIANATRDSTERVAFIGFDPKFVGFLMFCLSAAFAGLAGGLYAINYEIMTAASLGYQPTSMVIVMVYIGGVRQFGGPILGAFLITLVEVNLASYTGAWQLYLGILFVLVIMFAPDGLAGFLLRHVPVVRARVAHLLLPAYALAVFAMALLALGGIVLIEMTWRLTIDTDKGTVLTWFGMPLDTTRAGPWIAAALLCLIGLLGLRWTRPFVERQWQAVTTALQRSHS